MNIEKLNINLIKPYWRNPRKNEKAVEAVKKSILEYGYNSPIVVDKENVIIAGHTRYKALRELGYTSIDVVVLDISEEKAREYRIADNKSSELAEWDKDLLMFEMRGIEELGNLDVFFKDGEIEKMLEIQNIDLTPSIDIFMQKGEAEVREEVKAEILKDESVKAEIKAQIIEGGFKEEIKAQVLKEVSEEQKQKIEEIEKQAKARMEEKMREQIRENERKESERIKRIEEEMKQKFEKVSDKKENDYIEVQCPYCDKKYFLSKGELLRASKLQ